MSINYLKYIAEFQITLLIYSVLLTDFASAQGFHVGVRGTSCSLDPTSYNDPCGSLYEGVCDGAHCKCPPGTQEDQALKRCAAGTSKKGSTKTVGGGGDLFDLPLDYVPGEKPKERPKPEEKDRILPQPEENQPSTPVQPLPQPAQPPPSRPAQPRPPSEPQGPSQGYLPGNVDTNTNQIVPFDNSGKFPTHTGYPGHPNSQSRQPGNNVNFPDFNSNQPSNNPNHPGGNINPAGFDHRQPGSNPNQPSYNPNRSGYDHKQPGHDSSQPGYYPNQPGIYNPNQSRGGIYHDNKGGGTYFGGEKSLLDGFKKRSKN